MAHANDINGTSPIIDRVDDPILPDANAPQIASAAELFHAVRSRLRAERRQLPVYARGDAGGKIFDLARGSIRDNDGVISHAACQP